MEVSFAPLLSFSQRWSLTTITTTYHPISDCMYKIVHVLVIVFAILGGMMHDELVWMMNVNGHCDAELRGRRGKMEDIYHLFYISIEIGWLHLSFCHLGRRNMSAFEFNHLPSFRLARERVEHHRQTMYSIFMHQQSLQWLFKCVHSFTGEFIDTLLVRIARLGAQWVRLDVVRSTDIDITEGRRIERCARRTIDGAHKDIEM